MARQMVAVARLASVAAVVVIITASVGVTAELASGKFDGTWAVKTSSLGGGLCRPVWRDATIANDTFRLLWNQSANVYLTGTVDDTGTLPISDLHRTITGMLKYDGNKFVGEIKEDRRGVGPTCLFGIEVKKK